MRTGLPLLGLLLFFGPALRPAAAVTCTADAVPGATLLLPFFEVDLGNPNGLTTLFAVNNASASAALAHVVLWSDLSVPVLEFNVYLTGYDVQTINLRDILVYGNLPQTASAGQDENDVISPKGVFSQDVDFASCQGVLPPPPLPPSFTQHLQLALTGKASPILQNQCAGQNLGDGIARGYVTVDTVNNCTLRIPGDIGYFGPSGTGDVTDQNVLWGNWYIVDVPQQYVIGSTMVSIEADAANPATSTAGRYTFYGRYDSWTAVDHREPLSSTFAAQYFSGGNLFPAGTDLIVWRDPKGDQKPFPCPAVPGITPQWYPLGMEGVIIFDESEHPVVPQTFPFCPQPPTLFDPFPAATQMVTVGGAQLPVPFLFGWMHLDLNVSATYNPAPPFDNTAAQAYVISAHLANGHGVAVDAYRLDSVCSPNHFVP
ncbi:MAG TPA: hypothetical protein VMW75_27660 [Thermoanaerobaculia bacterium]|nr:hypothetical protein [Thermoanaerobaculia bacterium]